MTDLFPTNCITFNSLPSEEEVLRLDKEGFHYKGQFIADAGEAHRLFVEFLKANSALSPNANVLYQLAAVRDSCSDDTTLAGVECETLEDLASELTAPTLFDRALAGDPEASRQVLQQMGVIDANGQLTEKYRPCEVRE